jgi:hypothetical protein
MKKCAFGYSPILDEVETFDEEAYLLIHAVLSGEALRYVTVENPYVNPDMRHLGTASNPIQGFA